MDMLVPPCLQHHSSIHHANSKPFGVSLLYLLLGQPPDLRPNNCIQPFQLGLRTVKIFIIIVNTKEYNLKQNKQGCTGGTY